jgi:KUP system potassium uptake protein
VSAPFFLLTPEWARLPMVLLASYFLSKLELTRGTAPTMAKWRKRLFIATSMFSTDASVYFGLPPDRTVIMGERIEV